MENSKLTNRLVVRIGTTPYSPPSAQGETVAGELEVDVPPKEDERTEADSANHA